MGRSKCEVERSYTKDMKETGQTENNGPTQNMKKEPFKSVT